MRYPFGKPTEPSVDDHCRTGKLALTVANSTRKPCRGMRREFPREGRKVCVIRSARIVTSPIYIIYSRIYVKSRACNTFLAQRPGRWGTDEAHSRFPRDRREVFVRWRCSAVIYDPESTAMECFMFVIFLATWKKWPSMLYRYIITYTAHDQWWHLYDNQLWFDSENSVGVQRDLYGIFHRQESGSLTIWTLGFAQLSLVCRSAK